MTILKILYFLLGSISLGLGGLGVFVPGLPTTPFVLLATWFFLRSSRRIHSLVLKSRFFGPFISNYKSKKGISIGLKIYSLSIMWVMIAISCIFIITPGFFTVLLVLFGLAATWIKLFVIPTVKLEKAKKDEALLKR